jgi:hypothetical protein
MGVACLRGHPICVWRTDRYLHFEVPHVSSKATGTDFYGGLQDYLDIGKAEDCGQRSPPHDAGHARNQTARTIHARDRVTPSVQ